MAVSKTDQQDLNQLSAAADAAFPDVPCVASPRPSSFQTLALPPGLAEAGAENGRIWRYWYTNYIVDRTEYITY
jgi:hypothetical protein